MSYIAGCEASGTSGFSDRRTRNPCLYSSAMVGLSLLLTNWNPGLLPMLPMITTLRSRPSSWTVVVQVVQPFGVAGRQPRDERRAT